MMRRIFIWIVLLFGLGVGFLEYKRYSQYDKVQLEPWDEKNSIIVLGAKDNPNCVKNTREHSFGIEDRQRRGKVTWSQISTTPADPNRMAIWRREEARAISASSADDLATNHDANPILIRNTAGQRDSYLVRNPLMDQVNANQESWKTVPMIVDCFVWPGRQEPHEKPTMLCNTHNAIDGSSKYYDMRLQWTDERVGMSANDMQNFVREVYWLSRARWLRTLCP